MSQESAQRMADDPLSFYKSLSNTHRDAERDLLSLALENHVFPEVLRYDVFRDTFRGVVKAIGGDLYYFQLPPNGIFHIVKADSEEKIWEARRLLKACPLGCDLVKAQSEKKDDEEEEKEDGKAGAGGGVGTLPPPAVPEAQNVAAQDAQTTEVHPGGAMGTTPQQDGSEERWHGGSGDDISRALPQFNHAVNPHAWTTAQLFKAWGQELQQTAPRLNPIDPQLRRYMTEVLGKSPQEVDSGKVRLSGIQRAQYNEWLTKSLRGRMGSLETLLRKSRGHGAP